MNELREYRAYDCGCNSWSPLRDAVGSIRELIHLGTVYYLNQDNPVPNCPSSYAPTACKKSKHTVSRWYRTVYIPWLVASYDTHKANVGWILIPPSHRDISSVFTIEQLNNVPQFGQYEGNIHDTLNFNPEEAHEKPQHGTFTSQLDQICFTLGFSVH